MKKLMILSLVLLVVVSFLVKNNTNKIPADVKEKDKVIKVLVNDKLTNNIIDEISKNTKIVDIIFNNKEQEAGYKLTDSIKKSLVYYDAYFYYNKIQEPFAKEIIDAAGNLKLNQVCVTRGGTEVKSLESIPYYFLNGDDIKIAILNIKNAVQDLDPKNRDIYEKNYNTYIKLINFYLAKGKELGKELQNYVFIYPDDRYKMFTDYYNLKSQSAAEYKDSGKKGVFIYTDENELINYQMFINTYKLTTMKLSLPCDDGITSSLEKNLKYFHFLNGDIIF